MGRPRVGAVPAVSVRETKPSTYTPFSNSWSSWAFSLSVRVTVLEKRAVCPASTVTWPSSTVLMTTSWCIMVSRSPQALSTVSVAGRMRVMATL